jgi:hypothetical protein
VLIAGMIGFAALSPPAQATMIIGQVYGTADIFSGTKFGFSGIASGDAMAATFSLNTTYDEDGDLGGSLSMTITDVTHPHTATFTDFDVATTGYSATPGTYTITGHSDAGEVTDLTFVITGSGISSGYQGTFVPTGGYATLSSTDGTLDFDLTGGSGSVTVAEPAAVAVFGVGLLGLAYLRRRQGVPCLASAPCLA